MHQKREDFIVTVVKHGLWMISAIAVVGLLMLLISYFANPQLLNKIPVGTTAEASIFHKEEKKKPKSKLKLSTRPQEVRVTRIEDDHSLVIQGKNTKPKRVYLYLVTFPPKGYYYADKATKALKESVSGKRLWASVDPQAPSDKQVYLQTKNRLIQDKLLSKGYVSMHNFNGAEKYFSLLQLSEKKARDRSKGIWYIPGYVTDTGYNKKVGKLDE